MSIIVKILIAALVAPAGAVAMCAVVYAALWIAGTTESEGRRGLLAGVFGLVPGLVLGFCGGYWLVSLPGGASPLSWVADVVVASCAGFVAFGIGIVLGTRWAESRGISNYAGERAAWGMFYIALPLAAVTAIALFVLLQQTRT